MFFYLALFAYFAAGAALSAARDVHIRRGELWITAIILIVVIGFRWEVGADWLNYEALLYYSRITNIVGATVSAEPAYNLLNTIAATEGWGIWFPNLICAIIFTYGLMEFCRYQPNPWLALVVALPYLVIDVGMGYTRQSAAVGLAMLAMVQLSRGDRARMFISLGLAALFHTSAIVLVPLFALTSARRGLVSGVVLMLLALALYFTLSQRIAMRLSEYETYKSIATGALPRILMNVFAAVIFILFRRRFTDQPDELRLWTMISVGSFILIPLLYFVNSTTVVDRIGIFLVPLQIFVLARVPFVFGENRRQNLALILLIILYSFGAEFVWLSYGKEAQAWLPYRNLIWEKWFVPFA